MDLTCKVQINPGNEALEKLWQVSHLCTEFWNAMLTQRRNYHLYGPTNKYEQKKALPQIKKDFPEFKIPSSQVLQEVVFDLDRSYQMFFSKRKKGDQEVRPPKFKSRRYFYTQTYSQWETSFNIEDGKLKLAFGSSKKDWIHIEASHIKVDKPKTVKIKQDELSGKWYALLSYEVKEADALMFGHKIYFDPGCKTALTGIKTTGEFFEYSFSALRQINMSTYRLIDELKSKKDKLKNRNSKAWRRLNKRIKVLFQKIKTRTKMYLHTLANKILGDHQDVTHFMIGDWDKRKTLADTASKLANKSINRAVQNNNPLGILFEILGYKAKRLGQGVKKFDERGTTRTCSKCGHIHKDGINPTVRVFSCEACGFKFPRDLQSTLNFVKRYESALWQGLSGNLPDRSRKLELAPFSCKPQVSTAQLTVLQTS
jgi:putative transposase